MPRSRCVSLSLALSLSLSLPRSLALSLSRSLALALSRSRSFAIAMRVIVGVDRGVTERTQESQRGYIGRKFVDYSHSSYQPRISAAGGGVRREGEINSQRPVHGWLHTTDARDVFWQPAMLERGSTLPPATSKVLPRGCWGKRRPSWYISVTPTSPNQTLCVQFTNETDTMCTIYKRNRHSVYNFPKQTLCVHTRCTIHKRTRHSVYNFPRQTLCVQFPKTDTLCTIYKQE